jgi:hypothetical protein
MSSILSIVVDIDKYRYQGHAGAHQRKEIAMDTNIAAWMIAGGPRLETERSRREQEQLHAYIESQHVDERGPSLAERVRALIRPTAPERATCCAA